MFHKLFAAVATMTLGAGAASAATPATVSGELSLDARVQAAQTTIDKMIVNEQAQTGDKVAQYWGNHYRRPWHNWNNWRNYRRYYY